MAGFKETPRQKMIGMMYLVLTALLALNVSVDILNAFTIVNNGMERTNKNFEAKNNIQFAEFENQYQLNKAKVGPFYEKAKKAQELSLQLINKIKDVQNKVIGYTEFGDENIRNIQLEITNKDGKVVDSTFKEPRDIKLDWIEKKADYDNPMVILLGQSDQGTGGEATKLKEAFAEYKHNILNLLSKEQASQIKLGLNTEDAYNSHAGKKQNWELNTFYHTVLSADVGLLNKYIAEVMNIKSEVIGKLYENIDASDFKFDVVDAALIPKANIVIAGEPYEAQVFVAAYSSTDTPLVMIKEGVDTLNDFSGSQKVDSISSGVSYYRVNTSATGDFKYAGVIKVKKPDGSFLTKHFNSSYTVIKPSATVTADKMNVVYRGLANPLTIAAAGFTNDQIRLSSSGGGTLSNKGNGKYLFTPTPSGKAKEVSFRVTATKKDGSTSSMGPFRFRIKQLPSPTIRLAGKTDGMVDKSALQARAFLTSQLDDFLFEGVKYSVISYKLYIAGPGVSTPYMKSVRGPRFPSDALKVLRKARRGATVSISSVKVKGPDGTKQAAGVSVIIK